MKHLMWSLALGLALVAGTGCHSDGSKGGSCGCSHSGASACTCGHCNGSTASCNCPK